MVKACEHVCVLLCENQLRLKQRAGERGSQPYTPCLCHMRGGHPGFPSSCSSGKKNVTRFVSRLVYRIGSARQRCCFILCCLFLHFFLKKMPKRGRKVRQTIPGTHYLKDQDSL